MYYARSEDLIAIGRPGEPLPVPGADRMYATDAEWKDLVLQRMRAATLVVIRAGTGAGLLWEFGQAVSTLRPERVVVSCSIYRRLTTTRLQDRSEKCLASLFQRSDRTV